MLLNTVINRPLEKSVEKHNKHATRTMDCHSSLMIYDLVASCLFLLYSLRCGAAACRSVNITSLLHRGDLQLSAVLKSSSNLAVHRHQEQVQLDSVSPWPGSIRFHLCSIVSFSVLSFKIFQTSIKLVPEQNDLVLQHLSGWFVLPFVLRRFREPSSQKSDKK